MLLAGAPKDEGEGLCGAPLLHGTTLAWFTGLHILTPGCPLRRGMIAAAGLCQYWIPVSGAIVTRQFRILYSYLCSGWYRSRFSRVVELVSHVFHYWWVERSYLRLRRVLLWSFVGLPLTATFQQFRMVQAPFTKYAGCKSVVKMRSCG